MAVRSILDSEFDDLETPPRYRPESIQYFCRTTGFTESEIKKIYRNFKTECPTGLIKEDAFRGIYSQFFPQGGNKSTFLYFVLLFVCIYGCPSCVLKPTLVNTHTMSFNHWTTKETVS